MSTLLVDIWPKAIRAITTSDGIAHAAGDQVPIHIATRTLVTGAAADPPLVTYGGLLEGYRSRRRSLSQGDLMRVEWPAEPADARLTFANKGGCLRWWRDLSFDGARVRVRRAWSVADGTDLAAAELLFDGVSIGMPSAGDTVELRMLGSLSAQLRQPAQPRRYLGLGDALDFADGKGTISGLAGIWGGPVTVVIQGRHTNDLGYYWSPPHPAAADEWRFVRGLDTGAYRFRAFGVVVDSAPIGGDGWAVWSWDGTDAAFWLAARDGSGLAYVGGGAAPFTTAPDDLLLGTNDNGFPLAGSIGELRVYSRALTEEEIAAQLGRPLVLDDAADAQDLEIYLPLNEGSGTLAYDAAGGVLVLEGAVSWGSTGEGGADRRDDPMPAVCPGEAEVSLDRVSTLDTGNVARASDGEVEVHAVYSPGAVRLTPTWQISRSDVSVMQIPLLSPPIPDAADGYFEVPEDGVFSRLFRGVVVDTDYFSAPSTVAVHSVSGDGRLLFFYRANMGAPPPTPISVSMETVDPGWEPYPAAASWGVKLLSPGEGTFSAQVRVAGDATVEGHVREVLENRLGLDPSAVDLVDLGSLAVQSSSFALPPGDEVSAFEALRRLLEGLGVVVDAGPTSVTLRRVMTPGSRAPTQEIYAGDDADFVEYRRAAPPRSLRALYDPVYVERGGDEVPASDPELVARVKAGGLLTLPRQIDDPHELWPSSVAAPDLATTLVDLADAVAARDRAWRLAQWPRVARVKLPQDAESLQLGEEVTLRLGDTSAPAECKTGLEDGAPVVVVQIEDSGEVTILIGEPSPINLDPVV